MLEERKIGLKRGKKNEKEIMAMGNFPKGATNEHRDRPKEF